MMLAQSKINQIKKSKNILHCRLVLIMIHKHSLRKDFKKDSNKYKININL